MGDREDIENAIAALEAQRATLGEAVVETALAPLREKLAELTQASSERRRLVTILFADVSGFTALSERLDPEDVQDLLGRLWPRLDSAITRNRGIIDKHIGDAVMAVWGIAQTLEDDAAHAVRAALAMQAELRAFRQEEKIELAMRVGINTGMASVATVASTGETNVIGDTVNLASRLEHAAPKDGVLIGQSTHDQVRGLFNVAVMPPLEVKGKQEPVQAYVVTREKPRAFKMQTRGVVGVAAKTIGREAELGKLLAAYQRAAAGELQWVTVSGETGVGKTRLFTELERFVELQSGGAILFKGRAWPETQRTPFRLLRELLCLRCEIRDGDALGVARSKLTAEMTNTLGQALGEETAAFIGQTLGFDFSGHRRIAPIKDDPRQIRGRAIVLLLHYLERLTASSPVAVLIDDLQWADAESLSIFEAMLREPRSWRMAVFATARPSFWDWPSQFASSDDGTPLPGHERIELTALDKTHAAELARELLRLIPSPPEWLLELLTKSGGGNPFFTEELVHWLIARGVIVTEVGTWSAPSLRPPSLEIPGSVQTVLHERLAGLPEHQSRLLRIAAVIGHAFWTDAVDYVGREREAPEGWKELEGQDLVVLQPMSQLPGQVEYEFKHGLLRDVAYEYTLKKDRRQLHERVAKWLWRTAGDRIAEWAAIIAGHYELAENAAASGVWYGTAGKHAQEADAPDVAIEHYRKALLLAPDGASHRAMRVTWFEGLGEGLQRLAHYAEAVDVFRDMTTAASMAGDATAQARAHNGMSWVLAQAGRHPESIEAADRAATVATSIIDTTGATPPKAAQVELAKALHNRGWANVMLGNAEAALEAGEAALELASRIGAPRERALALNVLGVTHYYLLSSYEMGARYQEQALVVYRDLGDRWGVSCQLNNLGETARVRHANDTAVTLYEEALHIARDIGHRGQEMATLANLGGALTALGKHTEAERALREVIDLAGSAAENAGVLAETHRFLCKAELGNGKPDAALKSGLESLHLAAGVGGQSVGIAWRAVGEAMSGLEVASGAPAKARFDGEDLDAEACFARSLQAFTESGARRERAETFEAWARHEKSRGADERAEDLRTQADVLFDELGIVLPQR